MGRTNSPYYCRQWGERQLCIALSSCPMVPGAADINMTATGPWIPILALATSQAQASPWSWGAIKPPTSVHSSLFHLFIYASVHMTWNILSHSPLLAVIVPDWLYHTLCLGSLCFFPSTLGTMAVWGSPFPTNFIMSQSRAMLPPWCPRQIHSYNLSSTYYTMLPESYMQELWWSSFHGDWDSRVLLIFSLCPVVIFYDVLPLL